MHDNDGVRRCVSRRQTLPSRGADALAPLDAAMELPDEKYSPEVRRVVVEETARVSFDEVVELGRDSSGKFLERQAEELEVRAARDFGEF